MLYWDRSGDEGFVGRGGQAITVYALELPSRNRLSCRLSVSREMSPQRGGKTLLVLCIELVEFHRNCLAYKLKQIAKWEIV